MAVTSIIIQLKINPYIDAIAKEISISTETMVISLIETPEFPFLVYLIMCEDINVRIRI